ncbi:hypothetical protein [Planobispora rosea]|uniref:hypothetical protein n=1 Tax=Planobispora rosea TaxID=35762 RepID=UPI00114C8F26|nr:hypothetical protein [Planobispora rosea]
MPRLSFEERARRTEEYAERRQAAIEAIVAEAPPLSAEQIVVLRRVFAPTTKKLIAHPELAGCPLQRECPPPQ